MRKVVSCFNPFSQVNELHSRMLSVIILTKTVVLIPSVRSMNYMYAVSWYLSAYVTGFNPFSQVNELHAGRWYLMGRALISAF